MSAQRTTAYGVELGIQRLSDRGPGVAPFLPQDVAERLLAERGWQPEDGEWLPPTGGRGWPLARALAIALIAENS